ncbi:MAG: hypothetical protein HY402_02060 [Elusimicrobia bacterium]|nr:hypothetical protein [Elusimicrobiota bacterium]
MAEAFRFLDLDAGDAARQMAADEAVWACRLFPTLRIYRWSEPGMTFGYFQSFREGGVRRMTGGGRVFHGQDLTFSAVFPWEKGRTASQIYRRIHGEAALFLRERGLEVFLCPEGSGGEADCFNGPPVAGDLWVADRKVLGGALRLSGGWVLYQGSWQGEGRFFPCVREALLCAMRALGFAVFWRAQDLEPAEKERAQALVQGKYSCLYWNRNREVTNGCICSV